MTLIIQTFLFLFTCLTAAFFWFKSSDQHKNGHFCAALKSLKISLILVTIIVISGFVLFGWYFFKLLLFLGGIRLTMIRHTFL